jgi:cation diffusion facilitator family transporter
MSAESTSRGGFDHDTHAGVEGNERRTQIVIALTLAVMFAELVVGAWTQSLALLADGWHMATHAGALTLSAAAYWFARTRANRGEFVFGTGKVFALAGFTSAILLAVPALWMVVEAVERLFVPADVRFEEALPVAILGLVVNIVSVGVLHRAPAAPVEGHGHHHDHAHSHSHDHGHGHDHNLRAVYLHVVADALTSVLAIAALVAGAQLGWVALDPIMAMFGGVLILRWSIGLGRTAAAELVDATAEPDLDRRVRQAIVALGSHEIVDLHTWRTGPRHRSCVVAVRVAEPTTAAQLRQAILSTCEVDHLTVEVIQTVGS